MMEIIYTTAQDALEATDPGPRYLSSLEVARQIVAHPAETRSGRPGFYGLPVHRPAESGGGDDVTGLVQLQECWICYPVEPLLDGLDAHGRSVRDGLLYDLSLTAPSAGGD